MSELLHIIKKNLSYKQCLSYLELVLNDVWKDHLEITIDKIYNTDDFKIHTNLKISYYKKEVSGD